MSAPPVIDIQDVHKRFGKTHAVRGVSLSIASGEVFGFLGPNGAGKSTVVKMILGLVQPSSGRIQILGHPAGSLEARRQIGFLPETFRFHEWATATELLDFHARLAGLAVEQRPARITQMLDLVGLSDCAGDHLSTFSKGMSQRIGIAQALVSDPTVVILDEPTSALDPIGRREVRDLIRELRSQGTTVFLNSHLLSEVEQVCDRVAIIARGEVVATGQLSELLATREIELRLGTGGEAALASLQDEFGPAVARDGRYLLRLSDESGVARLVQRLVETGVEVYGVRLRTDSLEDVFVRLSEAGGP